MLSETYRELFTAVATCAAGLIGLLFVAISVAPSERAGRLPTVIQSIRAASALIAFTNALAVSLFGLVPSSNTVGYAALTVSVIGTLFTAASVRSIASSAEVSREKAWGQAGLIAVLLVAFGTEFGCGIGLITNHTAVFGPEALSNVLIALLLIGIARAWELVGNRDTGIWSSIVLLAGLERGALTRAASGHRHAEADADADAESDGDEGTTQAGGPAEGGPAEGGPAEGGGSARQ